ncbi:hypothetical protein KKD61_04070, partial [Patescibacteria group bacterium]|nr:hypothetical protein [Patescibacteria group bacterium]
MKYNLKLLNIITKDFKADVVFKLAAADFLIWLFLVLAKVLNFDFGLNSAIFFAIFIVSFGIWLTEAMKRNWQEIVIFLEEKRRTELSLQLVAETQEQEKEPVSIFALFGWVFKRYFLSKEVFLAIFFLGIAFDIFLISAASDLIILFFILWWLALNLAFKFKSRFSIAVALFFLALCPFLLIFKMDSIAEKAAIWAYMFLVVGT